MLKDVISEFEDAVDFYEQKNGEVEKYFKEKIKSENTPKGVLEFYKSYDGGSLSINEIFSLKEIADELKGFDDFLNAMGINPSEEKYIPIADDGMGGYYAFLSNKEDETIYYLDHEFPDDIQEYSNFEEFLNDICTLDSEI